MIDSRAEAFSSSPTLPTYALAGFFATVAAGLVAVTMSGEQTFEGLVNFYKTVVKDDLIEHCPDGYEKEWLQMAFEKILHWQKDTEEALKTCPDESHELGQSALNDILARRIAMKVTLVSLFIGGAAAIGLRRRK
ncbi:MAG: hypothetical protein AAB439_02710 [Patescibacteria group bacterium]